MNLNVAIVEDDPEFRYRFTEAVRAAPDLHLLDAAGCGKDALALLRTFRPDVMLVDLGLPDMCGTEVIRDANRRHPGIDILVVTMFGDDEHIVRSIEAGATGYLLKDTDPSGIVQAIRDVQRGGSPISPTIARRVLACFRALAPPPSQPADFSDTTPSVSDSRALSPREIDILKLVAKGFSFQEVGSYLGISTHTVGTHAKRVYRKLAVHSSGEAVYEASQMGLL
ncbi:MAG: response regulator [Leptothrix sp. (in: b-proteobacteria)]